MSGTEPLSDRWTRRRTQRRRSSCLSDVHRDGQDELAQGGRVAQAADARKHAHERLLRQVLDLGARPEGTRDQAPDARGVSIPDLLRRPRLTAAKRGDELDVLRGGGRLPSPPAAGVAPRHRLGRPARRRAPRPRLRGALAFPAAQYGTEGPGPRLPQLRSLHRRPLRAETGSKNQFRVGVVQSLHLPKMAFRPPVRILSIVDDDEPLQAEVNRPTTRACLGRPARRAVRGSATSETVRRSTRDRGPTCRSGRDHSGPTRCPPLQSRPGLDGGASGL